MYNTLQKIEILRKCIANDIELPIRYINLQGYGSKRTIKPKELERNKYGNPIVKAHDSKQEKIVSFNIDRIDIPVLPVDIDSDEISKIKTEDDLNKEVSKIYQKSDISPTDHNTDLLKNAIKSKKKINFTSESITETQHFEKDDNIDHDFVSKRLEELRNKLLDFTKRSALINSKHSERSKHFIRIIDELPNTLYQKIKDEEMYFKALPDTDEEPEDEKNNEFQSQLNSLRQNDEEYLEAIQDLGENSDDVVKIEVLERNLRDKLREKLGMKPIKRGKEFDIKNHAKVNNYNPDFNLPLEEEDKSSEHSDNFMQTLTLQKDLDRRMGHIQRLYNEKIQTMGVNALKTAFGFIQWYDSDNSEDPLYAPLLMLPVKLERKKVAFKDTFAISSENEPAEINRTIFEYFRAKFGLQLPEFDEEESPESYFIKIKDFLSDNQPKWRLKRWVTVSIYPFQYMASLEDLKEENWEESHHLTGHDFLAKLLAGKEHDESEYLGESYDIDKITVDKIPLPAIVLKADASQYSAVIDASAEKNLVIQGPPGTGKSQTIANIIASSVNQNKSVLFVAEKLPALKVVANRLKEVNLGPLLLELTKTKNVTVLESVKEALDTQNDLKKTYNVTSDKTESEIIKRIERLKRYKKLLYDTEVIDGLSASSLLWKYIRLKNDLGKPNFRISFENPPSTFDQIKEDSETISFLEENKYFDEKTKQIKTDSKINFLKIGTTSFGFENFQDLINDIKSQCSELSESLKKFNSTLVNFTKSDEIEDFETKSFFKILLSFNLIDELEFNSFSFANKQNIHLFSKELKHTLNNFLKRCTEYKDTIKWFNSYDNVDAEKAIKNMSYENLEEAINIVKKTGIIGSLLGSKELTAINIYLEKFNLLKNNQGKERKKDEKIDILKNLLKLVNAKNEISANKDLIKILGNNFKKEKTSDDTLEKLQKEIKELYNFKISLENIFKVFNLKFDIKLLDQMIFSDQFKTDFEEIKKNSKQVITKTKNLNEMIENFNENHVTNNYDFWSKEILDKPLSHEEVQKRVYINRVFNSISELIVEILENPDEFKKQISFSTVLKKSKNTALNEFIDFIKENSEKVENYKDKSQLYEYFVILTYLKKFDAKYQTDLAELNSEFMNKNRSDLRKFDNDLQKLNSDLILSKGLNSSIPKGKGTGPIKEWTEFSLLKHEITKKKGHISARNLLKRANNALKALKPVWLVPAVKVSDFLQRKREQFDILIIDEASQLPPERAMTSIIRSKQVIIVGDDQQLPPTSFFNSSIYNDYSEEDKDYSQEITSESILDLAKSKAADERTLRWHYRSKHQSLIEFSNYRFYDNKLLVFPSPYSNDNESKYGMEMHHILGNYKSGLNELEAKEVVEKAKLYMNNFKDESLAIVTINKRQMDYVSEEIERLKKDDQVVIDYFKNKSDDDLEPFVIMNLENFQGMERDNIIVSTVYGKEEGATKVRQNFGPINGPYGARRLNVLFTRARNRLLIVTSMHPSEIEVTDKDGPGKIALKGFLNYAATKQIEQGEVNELTADSEFEIMVAKQLENFGFKAIPQVGVAGFRIDIGVEHENYKNGFLAGIECDGAMYHSSYSARVNDAIRQDVLENLGWKIYRVWSTDWFNDPEKETKKMINWLQSKLHESSNVISFNEKPKLKTIKNEDDDIQTEQNLPIGNKRNYEVNGKVLGYYFETGPGSYDVWNNEQSKILGKIEKENLNLAASTSTYSQQQATRNLPKYIAVNISNTKKNFTDIFEALDWIYAS